jgi:hypothetical protein
MSDDPGRDDVDYHVALVRGVLVPVGSYPDRRIRDILSETDRVESQGRRRTGSEPSNAGNLPRGKSDRIRHS